MGVADHGHGAAVWKHRAADSAAEIGHTGEVMGKTYPEPGKMVAEGWNGLVAGRSKHEGSYHLVDDLTIIT